MLDLAAPRLRRPAKALVASLLLAAACGKDSPTRPELPEGTAVFAIRACASDGSGGQIFRIWSADPEVIAQATALVGAGPQRIVSGRLVAGDGGFNWGWSWHLDPADVAFADLAIEVCDGCPKDVEADLDYWLGTVGRFCPWSTEVLARER